MKIPMLVFAILGLSSTAFAGSGSHTGRPATLAETVARLEAKYPGEVIAIEFDGSGDKRPHYHVDMRFPQSGLARIDVDAASFRITARDPSSLASGSASLAEAAAFVAAEIPGQVTLAELDSTYGLPPHYDIDILLPHGGVARLKLDPATRQIAWRNPAILAD